MGKPLCYPEQLYASYREKKFYSHCGPDTKENLTNSRISLATVKATGPFFLWKLCSCRLNSVFLLEIKGRENMFVLRM